MKGANPRGVAIYVSAVGGEIVHQSSQGGWHVLLWLGHLDEVNAHIY